MVNSDDYADFLSGLTLQGITMLSSVARRSNIPLTAPSEMTVQIASRPPDKKSDGKEFNVAFLISASSDPQWDKSSEVTQGIGISVVFSVTYSSEREIAVDDETLEFFARSSALVNVWPFAREHIARESLLMGADKPVLLPLLIVPPRGSEGANA